MEKEIKYTLRLLKIYCYIPDEAKDDEVFVKYDGKKIWPEEKFITMNSGSEEINLEIKVVKGQKVELEIWDFDTFSANDLLGRVVIMADSPGGSYKTDMIKSDDGNSRYAIEWELN